MSLQTVETADDVCIEAFLVDIRAMCSLIGEASRYGPTVAMEAEYRRLRGSLSSGYRSLALKPSGFHGCGFEMILGSYSLEGLVRNSGVRAIERLGEVWRSLSGEPTAV